MHSSRLLEPEVLEGSPPPSTPTRAERQYAAEVAHALSKSADGDDDDTGLVTWRGTRADFRKPAEAADGALEPLPAGYVHARAVFGVGYYRQPPNEEPTSSCCSIS